MKPTEHPSFPIFDTHAHYDDDRFKQEPDILNQVHQNGVVGVITCGVNAESNAAAIALANQYDFVWAAVGIHPENINDGPLDLQTLEQQIQHPKVVAVGEIGLDYYWDKSNAALQKQLFIKQIEFANKHQLPVIVHDREAHSDTLEILSRLKPAGVVHCFSGSAETAKQIVNLGMYIGVGGVLTFNNAKKTVEVVKQLPLERLLLETDAPYLAPVPFRGKINRSDYIYYVGQKIAEIKGIDPQTVFKAALDNTKTLFQKIK